MNYLEFFATIVSSRAVVMDRFTREMSYLPNTLPLRASKPTIVGSSAISGALIKSPRSRYRPSDAVHSNYISPSAYVAQSSYSNAPVGSHPYLNHHNQLNRSRRLSWNVSQSNISRGNHLDTSVSSSTSSTDAPNSRESNLNGTRTSYSQDGANEYPDSLRHPSPLHHSQAMISADSHPFTLNHNIPSSANHERQYTQHNSNHIEGNVAHQNMATSLISMPYPHFAWAVPLSHPQLIPHQPPNRQIYPQIQHQPPPNAAFVVHQYPTSATYYRSPYEHDWNECYPNLETSSLLHQDSGVSLSSGSSKSNSAVNVFAKKQTDCFGRIPSASPSDVGAGGARNGWTLKSMNSCSDSTE